MSNLRVIYNNLADRATITANTTASGSAVANVQNDFKGQVHRTTGTTAIYTLNWATNQTIAGIILPATNLSATATINVGAWTGASGTGTNRSTIGTIAACTDTALAEWQRSGTAAASLNSNLFPYGGLSKTGYWFAQPYTDIRSVVITLTDASNPAGYIDCARVVCGAYWQPVYGADRSGLNISTQDTSTVTRTDNGDLLPEQGFVHDELSFNLGTLADADRNTFTDILRRYGTTKNVVISVFPGNQNSKQEQIYTVYGKLDNSQIEYNFPGFASTQIKITGW